jgi:hypothetical protein
MEFTNLEAETSEHIWSTLAMAEVSQVQIERPPLATCRRHQGSELKELVPESPLHMARNGV